MFRSSRRYQKQVRDELRRQNGSGFVARGMAGLKAEADRIDARKAAEAAAATESLSEELGRLARLRDSGVLTEAEFDQAKARVLRRP